MALTITNTIPIITPVYTPLEFTMSSPGCDYMELDVYIGDANKTAYQGTKRTIRIVSTSVVADIQGIVQPFFTSDASGTVQLFRVDVLGRTVTGGSVTEGYVDCWWVFNGCKRDTWDPTQFIMDGSGDAKFLNVWSTPIDIHWGQEPKLYFFQGTFTNNTGSYVANGPSFRVQADGAWSKGLQFNTVSTPQIREWNVGAAALNASIAGLNITTSTKSYTIDPSQNTGSFGLKTINIVPKDERYTPQRVAFIDSYGCKEYVNFDLVKTNTVSIKRQTFNNNGILKQYNNQVEDQYTITSNWITEEQSTSLKDLWYSPSVMVGNDYVIIQNKTVNIETRRGSKLINYTAEYQKSFDYKVQIY